MDTSPPEPPGEASSGLGAWDVPVPKGVCPDESLPASPSLSHGPRRPIGYRTESVNLVPFIDFWTGGDAEFTTDSIGLQTADRLRSLVGASQLTTCTYQRTIQMDYSKTLKNVML